METATKRLQEFLSARKMDTTLTHVPTSDLDSVNLYTIGDVLVIFGQKEKILDRDIVKYLKFAKDNDYTKGIIIVTLSDPSENVLWATKTHAKDRVQFFTMSELQFDISTHIKYYMPHRIMNQEEVKKMMEDQKITKLEQLPKIDSQDIQVRRIGAIPGDVIHIKRHSDTVGKADEWRLCVMDAHTNTGQ
jgi:DNA-directed RNA polymerase subunit H (RpoH/RPB5)